MWKRAVNVNAIVYRLHSVRYDLYVCLVPSVGSVTVQRTVLWIYSILQLLPPAASDSGPSRVATILNHVVSCICLWHLRSIHGTIKNLISFILLPPNLYHTGSQPSPHFKRLGPFYSRNGTRLRQWGVHSLRPRTDYYCVLLSILYVQSSCF
jgi:hypothetical protein